ncbi:MAG: hypothetical protein AWM53_01117 [Candidatus Dichloromethanomonas elyunquensis]|nr:MAG: hypothetical protein AWM53_01117 [Candidatus Dichloromethanomonas elyunquensis]
MLSDSSSHKFHRKGIKRHLIVLSMVLTVLMFLTGCNSLEDAAAKAKPFIPKGYSVVYIEQVSDNSGIVFYDYKEELSVGIFTKNKFGWDWIGSSVGKLVTYPEGLQWRYADLGDKDKTQYSVYYGKVINKDIEKITVTTTNGKTVDGKIVDTDQLKLWYAFVSEPQVPSVDVDIKGYSKDENIIYLFSHLNKNKEDLHG